MRRSCASVLLLLAMLLAVPGPALAQSPARIQVDGHLLPALASHPWAYPALEVVHLLGVGLLFGNLTLFELRVWGLGVALPVYVIHTVRNGRRSGRS